MPQGMVWFHGQPYPMHVNRFPLQHPVSWTPMLPQHDPHAHAHAHTHAHAHAQAYQHPPAQHHSRGDPTQQSKSQSQHAQHVSPQQRGKKAFHASSGSWQAAGVDTLHGPKAVFRKHSTPNLTAYNQQHHQNTRNNQIFNQNKGRSGSTWSQKSPGGSMFRRQSNVSNKNGGWHNGNGQGNGKDQGSGNSNGNGNGNNKQRRFNNGNGGGGHYQDTHIASVPGIAHPRHLDLYGRPNPSHFQHRNSGQHGTAGATGGAGTSIPNTQGNELCVNAEKYRSSYPQSHKYDPCSCHVCSERDRSVFVNLHKLYPDENRVPRVVIAKLASLLQPFGMVEDTRVNEHALTVV
ncbi:hypothetical protein GGR53DRAFT_188232 [Hypoxylon sp. FL1150]|nr:hypothetical protein GGR53DRAFT_188232 [Hypoxylon sp. FL1150]